MKLLKGADRSDRLIVAPRIERKPSYQSPFEKSWGEQSLAIGMSEAMEHEADHRQGDHRFRDLL
jgi:hypothetical protein